MKEIDDVKVLTNFYENDYLGILSNLWTAFVDNPKFLEKKDGPK